MIELTHTDFSLGLKKWNWRLKNYDYSLSILLNDERMIKNIPELEKYRGYAYCSFCAKYEDKYNDCPGCPFPKAENCFNSPSSIYRRWYNKVSTFEDASAETKEMVQLIRRLYSDEQYIRVYSAVENSELVSLIVKKPMYRKDISKCKIVGE